MYEHEYFTQDNNLLILFSGFMPLDIDYINKYYNYEESNCSTFQ